MASFEPNRGLQDWWADIATLGFQQSLFKSYAFSQFWSVLNRQLGLSRIAAKWIIELADEVGYNGVSSMDFFALPSFSGLSPQG